MFGQSIKQNALGLSAFAVLTAGVVAFTQQHTQDRVADNIRAAQAAALNEIMPAASHDNDLLADSIAIDDPELTAGESGLKGYIARQDGEFVGIILPSVAPNGYSGKIHSLVGIDAAGAITGVRILSHQETPGLGDKIEHKKSNWLSQFQGASLLSPEADAWKVAKDGGSFDQLTGATITPRAVVASVKRALLYFDEHKDEWLSETEQADDE